MTPSYKKLNGRVTLLKKPSGFDNIKSKLYKIWLHVYFNLWAHSQQFPFESSLLTQSSYFLFVNSNLSNFPVIVGTALAMS